MALFSFFSMLLLASLASSSSRVLNLLLLSEDFLRSWRRVSLGFCSSCGFLRERVTWGEAVLFCLSGSSEFFLLLLEYSILYSSLFLEERSLVLLIFILLSFSTLMKMLMGASAGDPARLMVSQADRLYSLSWLLDRILALASADRSFLLRGCATDPFSFWYRVSQSVFTRSCTIVLWIYFNSVFFLRGIILLSTRKMFDSCEERFFRRSESFIWRKARLYYYDCQMLTSQSQSIRKQLKRCNNPTWSIIDGKLLFAKPRTQYFYNQNFKMLRAYQYQFDLEISRVHLEIPFACSVQLWWRRGNKKIATKKKIELTGREKCFEVGEKLTLIAVCQNEHGSFALKPSSINVVIMTPGNPNKSGGYFNLELTEVLRGYDPGNPISRSYDVGIQACPTKNGVLHFLLSARCLQEITGNASFNEGGSFHSTTPCRSTEVNFKAEEERGLQSYGKHSNSVSELEFSFQQPRERIMGGTLGYKRASQELLAPEPQVTNETFYQLLEIKRKLDERNMEFAKLHNDFVAQNEKLKQYEGEGKVRDVRLMNEVNLLTQQSERLKRQLGEQAAKANEQTLKATKARQEAQRYESLAKRTDELQSQIFHKQSELISLETMMSARLKEAVASNEKLTETISNLNGELRTYYEKMKEFERQKLALETTCLREKEAGELKIRALEERAKEKDTVIDAVRRDFQKFAGQKTEVVKKWKEVQLILKTKEDQLIKLHTTIEGLKQEIKRKELIFQAKIRETIEKSETRVKQIQGKIKESEVKGKQIESKSQRILLDSESGKKQLLGKIQNLQAKVLTLEATLSEKDSLIAQKIELMEKAKDYVNYKEQQIQKRDAFINRAKQYVQVKETELSRALSANQQLKKSIEERLAEKDRAIECLNKKVEGCSLQISQQKHKLMGDIMNLRSQLQSKQKFLSEYLADLASANTRISELEECLSGRAAQISSLEKQIGELECDEEARSRQAKATMEELIKQNVQYQVQLGIYAREVKHMQEQLCQAEKKRQEREDTDEKENAGSQIKKARSVGLEISLERTKDKLRKMEEQMSLLEAENIALNVQLAKK